MFFILLLSDPRGAVLLFLAIIYALTIHEFSHVLAAYALGDNTGKQMGRLTLNPLAHIDWTGLVMFLLVGFGWGNPAPFNPYNLKYKKWGTALVALAGPMSNIISLFVFAAAYKFLFSYTNLSSDNLLLVFLQVLGTINLALLIFNLIPIPPLDGSKLLLTVLPERFHTFKVYLIQNGPMVLLVLVLLSWLVPGLSLFSWLFNAVNNWVYWLF